MKIFRREGLGSCLLILFANFAVQLLDFYLPLLVFLFMLYKVGTYPQFYTCYLIIVYLLLNYSL